MCWASCTFQLVGDAHQLTHQNVIVIPTSLMLPFSAFLLASFLATITRSRIQTAHIDGAGSRHRLRSVVLISERDGRADGLPSAATSTSGS